VHLGYGTWIWLSASKLPLQCAVVSLYSVVRQRLQCNTGKVCNCLIKFLLTVVLSIEWRKLQNEELNDLHSLLNIVRVVKSRRMRWAGHVARMWEERGVHRVLVGKPEGKRPLGRPRRRWEDNIKMDL
jgi:hypothetical protein